MFVFFLVLSFLVLVFLGPERWIRPLGKREKRTLIGNLFCQFNSGNPVIEVSKSFRFHCKVLGV